jgi:hypothetical protein
VPAISSGWCHMRAHEGHGGDAPDDPGIAGVGENDADRDRKAKQRVCHAAPEATERRLEGQVRLAAAVAGAVLPSACTVIANAARSSGMIISPG